MQGKFIGLFRNPSVAFSREDGGILVLSSPELSLLKFPEISVSRVSKISLSQDL